MAAFVAPIISGVSSLFGGLLGSHAATSAANIQNTAAQKAADDILGSTDAANSNLINSATTQGGYVLQQGKLSGQGVTDAAVQANQLLDPYAQAGAAANSTLQAGLAPGGRFSTAPTAAQIQMDPGFAARLAAGEKANERAAAAIGGVNSGSEAMALNNYAQTQASQEYQNAFNRYETATQNAFGNLNTVAGRGAVVAGQQGSNTIGAADYSGNINYDASKTSANMNYGANQIAAGNLINAHLNADNYRTQGANALAAGVLGKYNAISGAVNGIAKAGISAANIYNQMQNGGGGAEFSPGWGIPGYGSGNGDFGGEAG